MCLARTGELDNDGNPLSGNEAWRKSITLGSALCSKADIQRRINLGYAAFNNYKKAWSGKIPLHKRLLLYNALVVSVLMYNSSGVAEPGGPGGPWPPQKFEWVGQGMFWPPQNFDHWPPNSLPNCF